MSGRRAIEGGAIVAVPLVFHLAFLGLASAFDYPDVLRRPAGEVLQLFSVKSGQIIPLWWLMLISACAFVPVSVLLLNRLAEGKRASGLGIALGIAAGLVQAIGLSRWIFAVPFLVELRQSPRQAELAEALFQLLNRWVGMGIGEWLGYLFTALWTLLIGHQLWQKGRAWLGAVGVLSSTGILAGCLEVFGFSLAGPINAIAYVAWSLWMVALGILVIRGRLTPMTASISVP